MGGLNLGNAGAVAGGAIGGAIGGPVGAATGAGLGGAAGSWLGGSNPGAWANGLADHFGNPGHSNFNATPFQTDPNSFKGGWNDPNNPFSTGNMAAGAAGAQNQTAPGFANAQAGQGALAQMLMNTANGTAPSLAAAQLKAGQQTNAANTMAMQAQARGVNPSMAAYDAGQINSNANLATNAQAGMAGIAEREGAQSMLGNVLNQQGQLGLGEQAQRNQLTQYYTSMGMSQEQAQLQANTAMEQINSSNYNAAQGLNAGVSMGNANNSANLIGGLFSGGGALGSSAIGALGKAGVAAADGGVIPGLADGGIAQSFQNAPAGSPMPAPHADAAIQHLASTEPGLLSRMMSGAGRVAHDLNDGMQYAFERAGLPPAQRGAAGEKMEWNNLPRINHAVDLQGAGDIVPGTPTRQDSVTTELRPGEVVVPPEADLYDEAVKSVARHHSALRAAGRM